MKRITALLIVLHATFIIAIGQSYRSAETIAYINKYSKTAIREMYKYNIPASITLAQGILESGSGRSDLATKANNHFGIKCTNDYKGEKFLKDDDKKNDCFRVYAHADESFRDHSLFLSTRSHYASLFNLKITNYKGWAKGLKKAGYATNPKYPSLLIEVIEQNKLYEYDQNPEKYLARSEADTYTLDKDEKPDNQPSPRKIDNDDVNPIVLNGRINGVKCYKVKQGDTFYRIAKDNGLSVEKLMLFNDFEPNHILKAGEYVFLSRKKKKNKTATPYVVRQGDTALSISQKFGIRKKNLLKINKLSEHNIPVGMTIKFK